MNSRAAAAEEAVVAAALRQGLLTPAQLEAARRAHVEALRAARPSSLLALLAAHFQPADREALRRVYASALQADGAAADDADAEATAVLDMPAPPPPSAATAAPAATSTPGATVAGVRPPIAPTVAVGPPAATVAPPNVGAGPPAEVNGFQVIRELGRGGMGVVYEATHARHGPVALKVLLAGDLATAEDVERFKLEARASSSLSHPNVVRVLEHGQDAVGRWFMAMELVQGESLEAIVRREGPLPTLVAARIVCEVARALQAAHARSILHRDVKPHNVLMDGDTPRLTDFGLAKLTGDAKGRSLTASGPGVLGTPGYMAPEQAGGERKRIDARADVYGAGSLLYHLLTGQAPFEGDSLASVLVAVLQKPPVPPSQRRPGLPRDLETICLKCLEKEPDNRYPTAGALADDLERFVRAEEIAARPPGLLTRGARAARAHAAPAALATAGALALLVGLGLALRASLADRSPSVATLTEPTVTESTVTEPTVTEPTVTEPTVTEPTGTESTATESTATEPTVTEPTATESTGTEPTGTEPTGTESTATESKATESTATESTVDEPTGPRPTDADATGPPIADPTLTDPVDEPTAPVPTVAEAALPPPAVDPQATPSPAAEPLDPETVRWVAARCEALRLATARGAAPRLLWAPDLATAWREARDRNVPLVVVLLGFSDELPSFFRAPKTIQALNTDAVLVLAQKKDVKKDGAREEHPTVVVDGEPHCKLEPLLTCDQHHEAQKRLKDEDAHDRVLPGPPIELADKEDCRVVIVLPSGARPAELSDEPERSRLPALDEASFTRAFIEACNGAGAAHIALGALEGLVRAQAYTRRVEDLSRAIKAYRDVAEDRRATDLARRVASHWLEDGLVGLVDALIARIRRDSRNVKRDLRTLRSEVRELPRCVERVEDALELLDD